MLKPPFALVPLLLLSVAHAGKLESLITPQMPQLEAFYHELHEHPEVDMQVSWTAAKIAAKFRELGLDTIDNVGGGVVGVLRNGPGPVTLVRTELDALPMKEETGASFQSRNPEAMHACGHDLHMSALIGTVVAMKLALSKWHGTLVFVGQPGEETLKGAQAMIDAGLLKKIPKLDQCVAWHVNGSAPLGHVGFHEGPELSALNSLDVTLRGKGTHAGQPHKGIDPFVLTAEFILQLQTLVGRERDPMSPALISVGSVHGGTKHNIIPDEVKLQLSVRTFDPSTRAFILRRIDEIAHGLARTAGAPEPTVTVVESAPVLANDPVLAGRFRDAVVVEIGRDKLMQPPQRMVSEDFGIFGEAAGVPSLQFRVGSQASKDKAFPNHNAHFLPDFKAVLPVAVESMVAGLLELHRDVQAAPKSKLN